MNKFGNPICSTEQISSDVPVIHVASARQSENLKLKLSVKLGYGVGNFGMACITNAVVSYLLYFYTDIVILPPLLVGLALTIPRFWDAISDPLMGLISDWTQTSSGRRRPYIFWDSPLLVLSFVLLWYPFGSGSNTIIFSYLLIANLLFTTAITIAGVPYISLGGELTPHYHERTTIFAYNLAFGMIGGLIGMAMKLFADLLHFQNKSFRNLAIAMIIVNSGTTLAIQFLPFMLKYWVKLEHLLFTAYAVYTLAVYLGFPAWKKIGEKYDKKHVLAGAFLCAIARHFASLSIAPAALLTA